eukprot:9476211-Pyramimonas_sp.AAC.1
MEKKYGRKPFAFMIPSVTGNTRYSQKTECYLSSFVESSCAIQSIPARGLSPGNMPRATSACR